MNLGKSLSCFVSENGQLAIQWNPGGKIFRKSPGSDGSCHFIF
jgi:hypothetical protein